MNPKMKNLIFHQILLLCYINTFAYINCSSSEELMCEFLTNEDINYLESYSSSKNQNDKCKEQISYSKSIQNIEKPINNINFEIVADEDLNSTDNYLFDGYITVGKNFKSSKLKDLGSEFFKDGQESSMLSENFSESSLQYNPNSNQSRDILLEEFYTYVYSHSWIKNNSNNMSIYSVLKPHYEIDNSLINKDFIDFKSLHELNREENFTHSEKYHDIETKRNLVQTENILCEKLDKIQESNHNQNFDTKKQKFTNSNENLLLHNCLNKISKRKNIKRNEKLYKKYVLKNKKTLSKIDDNEKLFLEKKTSLQVPNENTLQLFEKFLILNNHNEKKNLIMNYCYNCCSKNFCKSILNNEIIQSNSIFSTSIPYFQIFTQGYSLLDSIKKEKKILEILELKSNAITEFEKDPKKCIILMFQNFSNAVQYNIIDIKLKELFSREHKEFEKENYRTICLKFFYIILVGISKLKDTKKKLFFYVDFFVFTNIIICPLRELANKVFLPNNSLIFMDKIEKILDLCNISRIIGQKTLIDKQDNLFFIKYYDENIPVDYILKYKDHKSRLRILLESKPQSNVFNLILTEYLQILKSILCKIQKISELSNIESKKNFKHKNFYNMYSILVINITSDIIDNLKTNNYDIKCNKSKFALLQAECNIYINFMLIRYVYTSLTEFLDNYIVKNFTYYLLIMRQKLGYRTNNHNKNFILEMMDECDKVLSFFDFFTDYLLFYIQTADYYK